MYRRRGEKRAQQWNISYKKNLLPWHAKKGEKLIHTNVFDVVLLSPSMFLFMLRNTKSFRFHSNRARTIAQREHNTVSHPIKAFALYSMAIINLPLSFSTDSSVASQIASVAHRIVLYMYIRTEDMRERCTNIKWVFVDFLIVLRFEVEMNMLPWQSELFVHKEILFLVLSNCKSASSWTIKCAVSTFEFIC